ncbi:MAG: LPS assembly lipoprotein LptE [Gammaproteobacteria bacterium]
MKRLLIAVMIAFGLSGCGYHLRGSTGGNWNLGRFSIQSPTATASEVTRLLQLNGVELVSPEKADAILTFTKDNQERQVLSVDPDTGKVREFELTVDVGIQVKSSDGKILLEDDSIALQRDFTFDETAALGKYEEEGALYQEIRKDLAAAIVRRLQAMHLTEAASK